MQHHPCLSNVIGVTKTETKKGILKAHLYNSELGKYVIACLSLEVPFNHL